MFERIGNGLRLTQQSFSVLTANKRLLVFPLFSAIACMAVFGSFMVPLMASDFLTASETGEVGVGAVGYLLMFAFYLTTYFVIIFFNTAIVECSIMYFRGQNPSVSDGLKGAINRLPQIAKWALLAATVGVILRSLEQRAGALGRFAVGLIGMAWSAATFFVVPVLVMERLGPIDATKRSTAIVKKTWAESLSAHIGIGVIAGILYFISALAVGGGVYFLFNDNTGLGLTLASVGVISFIVVALAATAMQAIVTSALYMYAGQGVVPDQFEEETLNRVFG